MRTVPSQWMSEQARQGHALYLILDSEGALSTRQALLSAPQRPNHLGVYSETLVTDLADAGPFIIQIDNPTDSILNALLCAPERNWGWLASTKGGEITALAKHWRERLIIGQRPQQALYRFHDNRVLARVLGSLPVETYPGRPRKLSATPDLSGTVLPLCPITNLASKSA